MTTTTMTTAATIAADATICRTTPTGALAYYVSHADPPHYNPTNITLGIMPPLDQPPRSKNERQLATSARALDDLARWEGQMEEAKG